MKMNAIFFYHYMEFMSSTPPENLIPYFSVEGPYIVSMALIICKVYAANLQRTNEDHGKELRPNATSKSDYINVKRSDGKQFDATASGKSGKLS